MEQSEKKKEDFHILHINGKIKDMFNDYAREFFFARIFI